MTQSGAGSIETKRKERRTFPSVDSNDERDFGQRDRDRILYSSALRRLGGVTQVVSPSERALIHNRLTHSFEVAQIGRGLADRLLADEFGPVDARNAGGLNPWVVEAAALAHDLGHPPFGHVAEQELNRLTTKKKLADGFEGNAQSFRVITKLAIRYDEVDGLDLSRATLCAVLKYPWVRGEVGKNPAKWGAYESERTELAWALELLEGTPAKRGLEAALMDWADDIAYAVHDMDDFFRANLIPLDKLVTDREERARFIDAEFVRQEKLKPSGPSREEMSDALERVMGAASVSLPFRGTRSDRASLRSFMSHLINKYIRSVSWIPNEFGEDAVRVDEDVRLEVNVLKGLTWYYVIESQSLASQRFGQRTLIRSLFEALSEAVFDEQSWSVFPGFYREYLQAGTSTDEKVRLVSDFISSMTEIQAVELHQRLTGAALGSGIEHIPL